MWSYIDNAVDLYGSKPVFIAGLFILHIVSYWALSGIFLYIDLYKSDTFRKYRTQSISKSPLTKDKLYRVIRQVAVNQALSVGVALIFYELYNIRGMPTTYAALPDPFIAILHFAVFLIIEEIGFYYMHRLGHYSYFYKYIHKQHHEWVSPVSISAIYCHPLEHICVNLIPLFAGPLVMNSHLALIWIWMFLATVNTMFSHCGYHLPLGPSNEEHDYHHLYFNECFGILGVLDTFHKTNTNYLKSQQYKRDKIYLPNEKYPLI